MQSRFQGRDVVLSLWKQDGSEMMNIIGLDDVYVSEKER